MKKYILTFSILLTLAGCSASASIAEPTQTTATPNIVSTVDVKKNLQQHSDNITKALKAHSNKSKMKKVVQEVMRRVNKTSYVFSGSSPRGWDCSGLVRWTYQQLGVTLPHSANKQGRLGARVSSPMVGDIVVFAYKGSTSFYHSAIYIGKNKVVNANAHAGTTIIQSLTDYKNSQIRYIRAIPMG